MTTEWRRIEGWPYEVSDQGEVRRIGSDKPLTPWRTKRGRWQVRISKHGKTKQFNIYRQVAISFLGPEPFAGAVVAHINDNLDDNRLVNLKWCTQQENCADRERNGNTARGDKNGARVHPERLARGEKVAGSVLCSKIVRYIRESTVPSRKLGRELGVSKTTILDVRSRKTWAHLA